MEELRKVLTKLNQLPPNRPLTALDLKNLLTENQEKKTFSQYELFNSDF